MEKRNLLYRLTAVAFLSLALGATAPVLAQTKEKPLHYSEQMPQFEGGETEMLKFLGRNIRYPEDAQKAGVEGLVVATFVIDTNGSLDNIRIVKSLTPSTDAEAKRVIQLMDGKWKPGKQDGKAVAVRYALPIKFMQKEKAPAPEQNNQPQFKGGQEALMRTINQNLKMPAEATKESLNAKVLVRFTVEKDGSVTGIKLEKTRLKKTVGPGSELDYMDASTFNLQNKTILAKLAEAAAAAVKATSGQWEPAKKNGQPVAAELLLPVQFYNSDAESSAPAMRDQANATEQVQERKLNFNEIVLASKLDEQPQFKDGKYSHKKFFAKNVRYPKTQAEGEVTINFMVYDDGKIGKVGVSKSMSPELKEEVLRVVALSKDMWQPGKLNGEAVNTYKIMTFRFVIDDGQKKSETTALLPADVVVTKYR